METYHDLRDCLPALWLRRAKLGFANAVMETRRAYARGWNLS